METKVIKIENTEDKVYKGLELLEELARKLIDTKTNAITIETSHQNNDLLLTLVGTYFTIVPTLKDMVSEYQKIKDSETFRNKIIDREIKGLTGYIEMLDVGKIKGKPTDFQVLKIQTQDTFKSTIAVLEKLKDTYNKDENTLKIKM